MFFIFTYMMILNNIYDLGIENPDNGYPNEARVLRKIPHGLDNFIQVQYIVQKGDSLWSIANKYNTTVSELIQLNNLTTTNLNISQSGSIGIASNDTNVVFTA